MPQRVRRFRETTPDEKQVARRLRERRRALDLSQSALAEKIGITRDRLASIEMGRVRLRLGIALKVADASRTSLAWLAEGFGPQLFYIPLGPEILQTLTDSKPFLEQYDRWLKLLFHEKISGVTPGKPIFQPLTKEVRQNIKLGLMGTTVKNVAETLPRIVTAFLSCCPPELKGDFLARINQAMREFNQKYYRELKEFNRAQTGAVQKKDLNMDSLKGKSDAMQSEIQKLISKVKEKAAQPGAKSELARELGVSPARISEWLSGKKEPGGEYALRLLNWIGPPAHK